MKIRIHNPIYGVPLSAVTKLNLNQFDIVDISLRWSAIRSKIYTIKDSDDYNNLNANPAIVKNSTLINKYTRLFIKRK